MPDARLIALVAIPAGLVGVVVAVLATVVGVPVAVSLLAGLAVALLLAWLAFRASGTRLVATLRAEPLDAGAEPRLDNLLDALCVNIGIDRPAVQRVSSPARNSAVFSDGSSTTMVVTDGLLGALDYMGLEALLGHQLSEAQQPDLEFRTRAIGLLTLLPGGLSARLASSLVDAPEPFAADIAGAQTTRYPPGQVGLLEVVASGDSRVGGVPDIAEGFWLVNPHGAEAAAPTHPPLGDRIALMREL